MIFRFYGTFERNGAGSFIPFLYVQASSREEAMERFGSRSVAVYGTHTCPCCGVTYADNQFPTIEAAASQDAADHNVSLADWLGGCGGMVRYIP